MLAILCIVGCLTLSQTLPVASPKLKQPKLSPDIASCPPEENISQLNTSVLDTAALGLTLMGPGVLVSKIEVSTSSPLKALWRMDWKCSILKARYQISDTVVIQMSTGVDYVNYHSWYLSAWGIEREKELV